MARVTGLHFYHAFFLGLLGVIAVALTGCASSTAQERLQARQDQARPSPDTIMTDGFYMNQPPLPEKERRHWDFFYKDCEFARRNHYTHRSEWDCKEP